MNYFIFVLIIVTAFSAFADTGFIRSSSSAICSRQENGQTVFYTTLHEAVEAASGISIDEPDEIILLADCILEDPIIIEEGQHIRLVSGNGDLTVHRGKNLLEYPLFWIHGSNSSLSLGKPEMEGPPAHSLVVDGGYLNTPPIEAKAPLVAVNGLYSKFVMYDNITLQNNYSVTDDDGNITYQVGAGVTVFPYENSQNAQVEFIMKGGIIQGNIYNAQNRYPFGGGVFTTGSGLFTMEDGSIMNNTAYGSGGGVHVWSRASFKKTGGIIYGKDASMGYRNLALGGTNNSKYHGHAVCVSLIDDPLAQYRNDTVGENDFLSYIGSLSGNGVFGEGEHWDNPVKEARKRMMFMLLAAAVSAALGFFLITRKIHRRKAALNVSIENANLSPREKETFDLLLTNKSIKEIADALNISYSGVIFHSNNIYRKLGVQNRTELLVKFRRK